MARVIWKGAISFGLVHIPVSLYPASKDDDLDFDWLDKRSMEPVGYKRINKVTGKEIASEQIVRGIKHGDGEYVVLSDEEIAAAHPKSTQTIDIEAFVSPDQIPFVQLEKPYYLAPTGRGDKVYALLREALLDTKRVGIAKVVISRKQHLAALIPAGQALMLNTLRWAAEIRPWTELNLPKEGQGGLKPQELEMARHLIDEMSTKWDPAAYKDTFNEEVLALVDKKAEAGDTETVTQVAPGEALPAASSNVVDLTDLLKRSLKGGAASKAEEAKPAPRKAAAKRKRA